MTARSDAADDLIISAARRAVAELAPEEEPFFDEVARAWRAGNRSSPGSSVGFGVDEILMTELFLQTIAGAVGEVLVVGGGLLARRRWKRRRAGSDEAQPATEEAPAAVETAAEEPPAAVETLVVEEAAGRDQRLREAVRRHAVTLGLTSEQADLLADAVIGALGPDSP
ncbi:hypothetical protein AB0M02_13580 [Actinoplanes sp. NPDC051861]|uniref:hypothetical protein n=1 Tax=Actinoplanes sp. NPDC051861 TaxID=3155170 RepID=UPI00342F5665